MGWLRAHSKINIYRGRKKFGFDEGVHKLNFSMRRYYDIYIVDIGWKNGRRMWRRQGRVLGVQSLPISFENFSYKLNTKKIIFIAKYILHFLTLYL